MGKSSLLYLKRNDIEDINITMKEIISTLEEMFKEKGLGKCQLPPKNVIYTHDDSFTNSMLGYIPGMKSSGIKLISTFNQNESLGLPRVNGLIVLCDPDTGIPIAIMDATWITAKRTGAASAVAAKYLARKESASLGIIACGVQGESNLEAICSVFNIKKVKAYDINSEISKRFMQKMSQKFNVEIEIVDSVEKAIRGIDIIITSGPIKKEPVPTIDKDWLPEGAFASPVDYDSYWNRSSILQIDKFATDDIQQMEYYRNLGYFKSTPNPYADLGEIVAGLKPGRENDSERTMSMNLGIALSDLATAMIIYKKAKQSKIGIELEL